jgi:hypothetical protein
MVLRLFCLFGWHHRSREHVRWNGRMYVSECAGCHLPMHKTMKGTWAPNLLED